MRLLSVFFFPLAADHAKSVMFCLADVAGCTACLSAQADVADFGLRCAAVFKIAGLAMMPPLQFQLIPFIFCCLLSSPHCRLNDFHDLSTEAVRPCSSVLGCFLWHFLSDSDPSCCSTRRRSTYNPCHFPGRVGTRRRRSCKCRSSVPQVMVLFSSVVVWNVGDLQVMAFFAAKEVVWSMALMFAPMRSTTT